MVSHWLGWISLALCIVLLAKFVGRISKNGKLNQLLRRIHKPLGSAILVVGLLHGVLCFAETLQASVTVMTGVLLIACFAAMTGTFYAKTKLKARWFSLHRKLSLLAVLLLAVHVILAT